MNPTFLYNCYRQATNIEDVKQQLLDLDRELRLTDMDNLIAFNHTYYIITRNVHDKFGKNVFKNENLMNATDTNFGNYYFDALKKYIDTNTCAPAWRILFEACRKNNKLQSIYMALGVNAHVNNDLPQTLHDVMNGDTTQDDFNKINELIDVSLHEVIISLHERNGIINWLKNNMEGLYTFFLNNLIRKWRQNAWLDYIDLHDNKRDIVIIEKQAEIKANFLSVF